MSYAGMINQSLLDYPGEIVTVLFSRGCNMRCPFCHNPDLLIRPRIMTKPVEVDDALQHLLERLGFLDGVVITGGEPTLNPDLMEDIRRFKSHGFLVKLDTNGTNPTLLGELLAEGWLDYVAMDIKAPLDFKAYRQAAGKLSGEDFFNLRTSIQLLMNSNIEVEFRTTVVPVLHAPEDILSIAQHIKGERLYTLQQFNPRITLEPGYSTVVPYTKTEMEEIADMCRPYTPTVRIINI